MSRLFATICLGLFLFSVAAEAKVVVYPEIIDKELIEDNRYKVYVRSANASDEWKRLQVLSVDVDMDTRSKAAMAQFDMDAPVEVKVVTGGIKVSDVKIRPLARGIQSKSIDEHTFMFRLDRPEKLSVEVNGDRKRNLHLFANNVEEETFETLDGEDVIRWGNGSKDIFRKNCRLIYFGPGVHQPKDLPIMR